MDIKKTDRQTSLIPEGSWVVKAAYIQQKSRTHIKWSNKTFINR